MSASFSTSAFPLHILLFGPFVVQINGAPMPRLRTTTGNHLFALLALRGSIPRKELAKQLWPTSAESVARQNLRQSVYDLRHALGAEHTRVKAEADSLTLDLSGVYVDVLEFDALVMLPDVASRQRALALYDRGLLLPNCVGNWLDELRTTRAEQAQAAREWLATVAAARGDYTSAIALLNTVLNADPWHETAVCLLMKAQAAQGEFDPAMQTYRDFRLRRQRLGEKPEGSTTALFSEIQVAARQRKQQVKTRTGAPPISAIPHLLPARPVALRGRAEDIPKIIAALDGIRMVTLTGCGGIGKTQLAVEVAHDALGNYTGGAWFVSLAAAHDPQQILPAIASVLGVREQADRPLPALVTDRLRAEPTLLILDNCEHLLPACAPIVQQLVQECPCLHILTTSRQPLGIIDEVAWSVLPLALPPARCVVARRASDRLTAHVLESPAVQLFLDRASQVRPGFALTPQNAGAVVRICCKLEGIPLALELAAAWVRSLTAEQIADRLDDCTAFLVRGAPNDIPRQQTLQATLDWSYELLKGDEQRLLGALSVFAGGWTLGAIEEIGSVVAERSQIVHLLAELVEKSLVVYEETNDVGRYRFLEPIRQYAEQKRPEESCLFDLHARHLDYFLQLVSAAEPHLFGNDQAHRFELLDLEKDNFRIAIDRCCNAHDAESGLRLAGPLGRFWQVRNHFVEGLDLLERLLALLDGPQNATRLKALRAAGVLAYRQANHARAEAHYQAQLALAEKLGDRRAAAGALGNLGNIVSERGDLVRAREAFKRCLAEFRELGDQDSIVLALSNLAVVACRESDYGEAHRRNVEVIALLEHSGDTVALAIALNNQADVSNMLEDLAASERLLRRSLVLSQKTEDRRTLANSLDLYLCLLANRGVFQSAAIMVGAVEGIREEIGIPTPRDGVDEFCRQRALIAATVGEPAFTQAVEMGQSMSLKEIVDFALSVTT